MSISDTGKSGPSGPDAAGGRASGGGRRQAGRAAIVYLFAAVFCVIFDYVYALFGHGVRSAAMSLMFLYPLIGGVLPFFLRWLLLQSQARAVAPLGRIAFNAYNSGIATLTIGSLLTGVFEIAGTTNPYLNWFRGTGILLVAAAILVQNLRRPGRSPRM